MPATTAATAATHEVVNQTPPFAGFNVFTGDPALGAALARGEAGGAAEQAAELGAYVGSEEAQRLADLANRHLPELRTHDAAGRRLDLVEYHPAYHALMEAALRRGLHLLPWSEARPGAFTAHAALFFLWN